MRKFNLPADLKCTRGFILDPGNYLKKVVVCHGYTWSVRNYFDGNQEYTYAWFDCEENEVLGTDPIFTAAANACYCVTVRDTAYARTFCTIS